MRRFERHGKCGEFLGGQGGLDQWEQDALFVADVRVNAVAELVQVVACRRRIAGEVGGAAAQVDVIGEDAHDGAVGGRMVARQSRQQEVLLRAEVALSFVGPEPRDARRDGAPSPGRA